MKTAKAEGLGGKNTSGWERPQVRALDFPNRMATGKPTERRGQAMGKQWGKNRKRMGKEWENNREGKRIGKELHYITGNGRMRLLRPKKSKQQKNKERKAT